MIYEENPMHIEIVQTLVPVANEVEDELENDNSEEEVRIDVEGEVVIDPKRDSVDDGKKNYCEIVGDLLVLGFCILFTLSFIGGFILFLVWLNSPNLFGTEHNPY
jgi:hypothetical protein